MAAEAAFDKELHVKGWKAWIRTICADLLAILARMFACKVDIILVDAQVFPQDAIRAIKDGLARFLPSARKLPLPLVIDLRIWFIAASCLYEEVVFLWIPDAQAHDPDDS
jgi:hypothetical protein